MAIRKRGAQWFGDSHADIHHELIRYGKLNEYEPTHFADARCACGSQLFRLSLDDNEGAAVQMCVACFKSHPIGDSDKYLDVAELEERRCVCGEDIFQISVGVSLYPKSDGVRWLYVGCRCPSCDMIGCYGDWKNEFSDYRKLLDRV